MMASGKLDDVAAGLARIRDDKAVDETLSFASIVGELRATFESGKTKNIAWRKQQLEQVKTMLVANHEEITKAVTADLGGPKVRGIFELGVLEEACTMLASINKWTADQPVPTPLQLSPSRLASSYIRPEPKGVVLIIGPWNFPFDLCLRPLVNAIAAGCCVVIKPSEVSPNSAALIETMVSAHLDPSCLRVVQGAVAVTTALLKERWDHIFYTGNSHVGRIVLKAAAENLTSVTLELGGKSPVIVDKSAKMESVVSRVSSGKWLNAGQICIAPDYVLIHKDRQEEFVAGMMKTAEAWFGKDPKQSRDWGRIVSADHVGRIKSLLESTKGQVVMGGAENVDAATRYFPPTLVKNASIHEPLLREEIFGPVLPIVTVDDIKDAVQKVNSVCDRPLALYVFSEDKQAIDFVLGNTLSGGVGVNTSLEQIANPNLPFGGVGSSGQGAYHGKAGFDEFTHMRAVLHQDTLLLKKSGLPPPPYTEATYDLLLRVGVIGFLSESQKNKLKLIFFSAIQGLRQRPIIYGVAAAMGMVMRSRL